jgi:hypothetical protein
MEFLKALSPTWAIGLVLFVTTVAYFAVDKSWRYALIKQVTFRGRKVSMAKTPPRSVSPEKPSTISASPSSYSDVLPPSRREALSQVEGKRPTTAAQEVSEREIREDILPMTADYGTSDGNRYTPTGFSVDEVKALGDFPDYATLSGVPLPNAYREFDIDKARPRPYRPFRWAYHQTMCTSPLNNVSGHT